MKLLLFVAASTFISALLASPVRSESKSVPDNERLFEHVMGDYNKNVEPFETPDSKVEVEFGVTPLYLDLDQHGILKGRVWYKYSWTDSRLAFDPAKFGGIANFKVDSSLIWVPDITLYNRHDSHRPSNAWKVRGEFANAIVYPNGKILLIPDTHLEAVCHEANLRDFWAEQNCTLKYGSWTYDGNLIDLKFFGDETEVDVSEFRGTNPIKIVSSVTEREVKSYDCCPEPYPNLQYKLVLQRQFKVTPEGLIWNPKLSHEEKRDEEMAKTFP